MDSHIFLDIFIKNYNNESIITVSTFNDLYTSFIIKSSYDLKLEIETQLLKFPDLKENYLDYVRGRITSETQNGPNIFILEQWIKDYQLQDLEFPFTANSQINEILNSCIEFPDSETNEPYVIEAISKYFYKHAFYLEKLSILQLIQIQKPLLHLPSNFKKPICDLDPIFKSAEGYNAFLYLLDQLGINHSTVINLGTQAMFNGIWGSPTSKKIIFKQHAKLKDYIRFLNNTFNSGYTSRSMSDGSKYHDSIKNWLNEL